VRPRRILTRNGGRPGDSIYVSGLIGGAAAGLAALKTGADRNAPEALAAAIRRHQRPEPRLRLGMLLGRNRAASACMDLSDGLADAIRQIATASGTGAAIDATALPIDPAASAWFAAPGQDPVLSALSGGDDYELLFTVSKKLRGRFRGVQRHAQGVALTRIGELTQDPRLLLSRGSGFEPIPEGFSHFSDGLG
jgi:thiamine-monophosphate kinase